MSTAAFLSLPSSPSNGFSNSYHMPQLHGCMPTGIKGSIAAATDTRRTLVKGRNFVDRFGQFLFHSNDTYQFLHLVLQVGLNLKGIFVFALFSTFKGFQSPFNNVIYFSFAYYPLR